MAANGRNTERLVEQHFIIALCRLRRKEKKGLSLRGKQKSGEINILDSWICFYSPARGIRNLTASWSNIVGYFAR